MKSLHVIWSRLGLHALGACGGHAPAVPWTEGWWLFVCSLTGTSGSTVKLAGCYQPAFLGYWQVQKSGHFTDENASRTELHNLADRFHTVLTHPIDTKRLAGALHALIPWHLHVLHSLFVCESSPSASASASEPLKYRFFLLQLLAFRVQFRLVSVRQLWVRAQSHGGRTL